MSFEEFQDSIAGGATLPAGIGPALAALWHDARGDWDTAHACAQEEKSRSGAWVHAYLHRKEGDVGNARYWYARAGRTMPETSETMATEWASIAKALLATAAAR